MPVLTFEQSKALEEKLKSAAETVVVVETPMIEEDVAKPDEIITIEAPVAEAPKQQKRKGKKK